jgi:squalene-hopene/tetraprenyl-beta-curcumene cyclase
MRIAVRLFFALVLAAVIVPVVADSPQPHATKADAAASNNDAVLHEPDRALDERIAPDHITDSDLPPLPETVVLPKPPTFRLAADTTQVPISEAHYQRAMAAMNRGVAFLKQAQDEKGRWMAGAMAPPTDQPDKPSPVEVAVTAMAIKAIVQHDPEAINEVTIRRALNFVRMAQNDDGTFEGGSLTNYVTSIVVSAFAAIDREGLLKDIAPAVQWLVQSQWDQSEGLSPRQDWFGGAGYGNHGRPDMSNTQMMLDALYDAGMSPDDPAFQRAVAFISRAQNYKATNASEWAGDDGGFIYTPANGGESMASEVAGDGRHGEHIPEGEFRSLRSYGSMTYAGFKSLLYAGLSPDDARVRAAFDWIRKHWTFEENPGVGQMGLYYYYHTMSRALSVGQQHIITTPDGDAHNWREELIDAIVSRQRDDGSWVNEADRWMEGHPDLVTCYSLLALEEALKPVLKMPEEQASASK